MLKIKILSTDGAILTMNVLVEGEEELTFILSVDMNTGVSRCLMRLNPCGTKEEV